MRAVGPRLGPMVTASALLHVVAIGYTLATVRPQPRIVFRPAYTVDLVDAPRALAPAPAPPPAAPAPTPPPVAQATPPPLPPAPAPRATPPPATPVRTDMADLDRQRLEAEKARQEAERARLEAEKARQEAQRLREAELERQRADAERARQAEIERQRQETEKVRQAEAERQRQETEKVRQAEAERQRQEAEKVRQAEAERQARIARLDEERSRIREDVRREAEAKATAERVARVNAERQRLRTVAAEAAAARAAQEALEIELRDYLKDVDRVVRSYWLLPEWVRRRNVEVVVSLTVSRDGRILSSAIEKRSGFADLDQSVMRAIERARQEGLPPLPKDYKDDRYEFGLIFNPSQTL